MPTLDSGLRRNDEYYKHMDVSSNKNNQFSIYVNVPRIRGFFMPSLKFFISKLS
jgi:hypothetical protein